MNRRALGNDAVADAGASFRGIAANDRRHNRDRTTIRVLVVALAALWVVGAAQFFWGTAWNGVIAVFAAAAIGSGAAFVYALRGAATAAIAGLGAGATTGWLAWSGGLNWGFLLVGVVLPPLAVMAVMSARAEQIPRLSAAVIAAVLCPAVFLLAPLLGGWVVLVAGVAVVAFLTWQIDLPYRRTAKHASLRSGIPMLSTSPFASGMFGVAPPSGVDQATLKERVDANQQTAQALAKLPAGWYVFHSRAAFTGDLIDHVVVGPPGVFVLRSEFAPGVLRLEPAFDGDDGVPVARDGDRLPMIVSTVLCETAAAVDLHLLTPGQRRVARAVMVATDAVIDECVLHQQTVVEDGDDQVDWVAPANLVTYLKASPSLRRSPEFVADLATVLDYQLPPVR
ncbi:hypothetical protein ACFQNE_02765 [Gordonia phosphorivorans]|uniref:NERD domain-containing protein n=1 Tax=Gordonia phosphorivorans TaxID=1056982 RepID=A0ABV6H447_9ACTN